MKKGWYEDILNFFYPRLCQVCGDLLVTGENLICTHCIFHLPRTHYHKSKDNPVSELFWGRIPLEAATAYYHFEKGSVYQELLHKMKYKGHKEIGFELGRWLGIDLRDSEGYAGVNCIIPVPLHPKKEKKRGYNQSEWIARGIGRGMELPVETGNLVRIQDSATQTRKSRIERWENVEKIFSVLDPGKINGRHVLLVDDVVTTGATLEACASTLLEAGVSRVSIATLAVA